MIKKESIRLEALFKKLSRKEKNICYIPNKILTFNPAGKFSCKFTKKNDENKKQLQKFHDFFKDSSKKHLKLIGYFSYDIGYFLHNIKKTAKDDLKLPDIYFLAFENWITEKNKEITAHFRDKKFTNQIKEILKRKENRSLKNKKIRDFSPATKRKSYDNAYHEIKNYIKEGDIYQINLTHRLEAKTNTPSKELFLKVAEKNPVEFLTYMEGNGFEILSASPEQFVEIKDRKITTFPIKGTTPRGSTKKQDEKFKNELINSQKEAAELNMITDLLRNDLGKICKSGSVKVKGSRILMKCPKVWHTYSEIKGTLRDDITEMKGVISMLPGGSITGCPKKRAMEIIDKLEPTTRSIYTGVIGHNFTNGKLDFSVAIRTIIKKKDKLYLQVGGGIVFDSKNKKEFEETLHKAKSFMKILK